MATMWHSRTSPRSEVRSDQVELACARDGCGAVRHAEFPVRVRNPSGRRSTTAPTTEPKASRDRPYRRTRGTELSENCNRTATQLQTTGRH